MWSLLFLAVVAGPNPSLATTDPACPFSTALPPSDLLIGYIGNVRRTNGIRLGSFRILGVVRKGTLVDSDGSAITEGMNYWNVLAPSTAPATLRQVSSHLDRLGKDHCVFHAEPEGDLALWTLLSDRPLRGVFHEPDPSEIAYFARHHDICVDQGDYRPAEKPPCSRPRLLAVSELKRDGEQEYWATEPYTWDTGITVWRRTESGLARIKLACAGCSD